MDAVDKHCLSEFGRFLFNHTKRKVTHVKSLKSAQQRVFLLSIEQSDNNQVESSANYRSSELKSFLNAVEDGIVILRVWRGSARWWNLNLNTEESCSKLARAEVAGYRLARRVFESQRVQCVSLMKKYPINIPEVLHFQPDEGSESGNSKPWAVFSYAKQMKEIEVDKTCWEFSDKFVNEMVKKRHEFGFEEPHPRHGRVCVADALEYALQVLTSVVLPMHAFFFSHFSSNRGEVKFTTNARMVDQEIDALVTNCDAINAREGFTYNDMLCKHRHIVVYLTNKRPHEDRDDYQINQVISILGECLRQLSLEWASLEKNNSLPPVLCHLDLQPQNMILFQLKKDRGKIPTIASVLDWEESCYADPRFEILIICRKVVANREQADLIWEHYAKEIQRFGMSKHSMGPIEPWLKLEAVHSLMSMLLQGMDLQGGGRNPWEEKPDLWRKISRELSRLKNDLGWAFCSIDPL